MTACIDAMGDSKYKEMMAIEISIAARRRLGIVFHCDSSCESQFVDLLVSSRNIFIFTAKQSCMFWTM